MKSFDDLKLSDAPVLSTEALHSLRHCLGITRHNMKRDWGKRNVFVSYGTDVACEQLVAAGLMDQPVIGKASSPFPAARFYRATPAGMELVGLSKAKIKNLTDGGLSPRCTTPRPTS